MESFEQMALRVAEECGFGKKPGIEEAERFVLYATRIRDELCKGQEPAKARYDRLVVGGEEPSPVERLRFFCSLAMTGQDWIDVEPFFDAITHTAIPAEVEALRRELADYKADQESYIRNIAATEEQLAASQAREQQLREALQRAWDWIISNPPEDVEPTIKKALAIPPDDTALKQWGAKLFRDFAADVIHGKRKLLVSAMREYADELEGKS